MNQTRLRRRPDGTRQVPPPQVFSYRANHPLSCEPEASARRRPLSNERRFPIRPASLQRPGEPATRLPRTSALKLATQIGMVNVRILSNEALHKKSVGGVLTPTRPWLTTTACGGERNRRRRRLPQKTFCAKPIQRFARIHSADHSVAKNTSGDKKSTATKRRQYAIRQREGEAPAEPPLELAPRGTHFHVSEGMDASGRSLTRPHAIASTISVATECNQRENNKPYGYNDLRFLSPKRDVATQRRHVPQGAELPVEFAQRWSGEMNV
jgi:hypothetical protein